MSTISTKVILVRHGETVWNNKRKFQGNKNSILTDAGISQAAETGKLLKNIHIDSVNRLFNLPKGIFFILKKKKIF